jgi:hypothetical protein
MRGTPVRSGPVRHRPQNDVGRRLGLNPGDDLRLILPQPADAGVGIERVRDTPPGLKPGGFSEMAPSYRNPSLAGVPASTHEPQVVRHTMLDKRGSGDLPRFAMLEDRQDVDRPHHVAVSIAELWCEPSGPCRAGHRLGAAPAGRSTSRPGRAGV